MPTPGESVVGIDLGTTNCAVASSKGEAVTQFEIPQLVRPGGLDGQSLFPSCLFVLGPGDFAEGATALPWDGSPEYLLGQLAKVRGAEVPDRLIVSAKSWLCHSGVDRTSALLPAAAPDSIRRVSPVEATRRYLEHLRQAWNFRNGSDPFDRQRIVVTVPASFDAVARDLTLRAAADAAYPEVVLLEEPQAAFYAWIERHPNWREAVRPGSLILVVDIGGGTTDFSLISVVDAGGELGLERVAVGEHILLGGDNMDLALAHRVEQELSGKGVRLDPFQFNTLWQNCRTAKEKLFANDSLTGHTVTVPGRGSGLIGGAIQAKLARAAAEEIVVEGFFPRVPPDATPEQPRRSAIREIGLPYAADACVTRHLAKFLRQAPAGRSPTHVLFNGGVFHAGPLRRRMMEVLDDWMKSRGAPPVVALEGEDLMHAVSRGAAYFGWARAGKGIRIRSGISRTYYIGVQSSMPAVPGMKPPMKALTVAQFGMEEGSRVEPSRREFGLLVGEPAEFRFFGSVVRKDDTPGTLLEGLGPDLEELVPVEVTLPADDGETSVVPVRIETEITATGQLQLWCVGRDGARWKLEFNVRESV
jgi:hypothetical protein